LIDKLITIKLEIKSKDPKNLKSLLDLEMNRKKYNRSDSEISISKDKIIMSLLDIISACCDILLCIAGYISISFFTLSARSPSKHILS
jgi:hypothetical protein